MNYPLIPLILLSSIMPASSENAALLIIDIQNCFVEGGSLAVTEGASLALIVNSILNQHQDNFTTIAYSLDFHPADHISFASQHIQKEAFSSVTLHYDENGTLCQPTTLEDQSRADNCSGDVIDLTQDLWPDHCVGNTEGANFIPSLHVPNASNVIFIRKGSYKNIDSYSAFYNNGHYSKSELNSKLKKDDVKKLFIVGIATDYCVKFSALDAKELGYDVYVVEEATAGVSQNSTQQTLVLFQEKGIHVISMQDLPGKLYLDEEQTRTSSLSPNNNRTK